ncbi:MAG TPA: hypothetical protein VFB82_07430 [Blastocatellia bacterium]|nr:hypothetical protein [Blastocatellia bacterium]
MVRKHVVSLAALLVLVAFWFGAREFALAQQSQPQATKSSDARKWEYCTINGIGFDRSWNTSSASVSYLTHTGRRFETLDCGSSPDPLASAFAKLGSDGWELVGQVMYSSSMPEYRPDTWLFKRPIR